MDLDELTLGIGNELVEKGATEVELLQVEQKSKLAKRLIVCTVQDNICAKKVALELKEMLKDTLQCFHTDGIFRGDWIVLDYDDIIVHIFTKETRQKFNIDKLYKDTKNFVEIDNKN